MKLSTVSFALAMIFLAGHGAVGQTLDWAHIIPSHFGSFPVKTSTVDLGNKVVLNLAIVTVVQNNFQANIAFGALVGSSQTNIAQNSAGPIVVGSTNLVGSRKLLGTGEPAELEDVTQSGRTLLAAPPRSPTMLSLSIGNTEVVNLFKISQVQANTQSNVAGYTLLSGQANSAANFADGTLVKVTNVAF